MELIIGSNRAPLIYSTAAYTTLTIIAGEHHRTATSPVHAKIMGTEFTACGQRASTWAKMYDQLFAQAANRCEECVDALTEGMPAHFTKASQRRPVLGRIDEARTPSGSGSA